MDMTPKMPACRESSKQNRVPLAEARSKDTLLVLHVRKKEAREVRFLEKVLSLRVGMYMYDLGKRGVEREVELVVVCGKESAEGLMSLLLAELAKRREALNDERKKKQALKASSMPEERPSAHSLGLEEWKSQKDTKESV